MVVKLRVLQDVWSYNIRLQKAAKHAAVPKYRTVVVFCGQQATCSEWSTNTTACTPLNDTCVRLTTKYCWTSNPVYGRCDLSTAGTRVLIRPHRILRTVQVMIPLVPAIQSGLLHTFARSSSILGAKDPYSRNLQPRSWVQDVCPNPCIFTAARTHSVLSLSHGLWQISDCEHRRGQGHAAQAWSVSKHLRHSAVGINKACAPTVGTQVTRHTPTHTQWLARWVPANRVLQNLGLYAVQWYENLWMTNWDRSGVSRQLHGGTEETCVEGQGSPCAGTDGELATHDVAVLQYRLKRAVRYLKKKLTVFVNRTNLVHRFS